MEDVGISQAGIEAFVQKLIDLPMDSLSTSQIHSVLIARQGKLVVEEYFDGYHRDRPNDTRSAAKSWTAVLLCAAMQAGVPIRLNTPVYRTMLDSAHHEVGPTLADLDPRKRAMTLEHLISMTAGYNCAGDTAPGNEDVMQSQTEEPDWYCYTLNVPMLTAPGDTIVYTSIEPNLRWRPVGRASLARPCWSVSACFTSVRTSASASGVPDSLWIVTTASPVAPSP